jgi:hypothetical protein
MYRLFAAYWRGWMHVDRVTPWCDHGSLPAACNRPEELPFTGEYVAVKFYFSDCLPCTDENRAFVRRTCDRLAARLPVVLLNTGLNIDDHHDATANTGGRVFDATPLMTPATNLEVQTALVANARYLICTYGGFSYLGPLLGVPTVSFYSRASFEPSHLQLAHKVFNRDEGSLLAAMPTGAADMLWQLFGGCARRESISGERLTHVNV